MQKLFLPIQDCMITAGYQNAAYVKKFGFAHFGQDLISVKAVRNIASGGEGKVLLSGMDNVLGNVLAVLYPQVYNHKTGKTADVILRYAHFDRLLVRAGDRVVPGATLGQYGNTGKYSFGPHLHIEADYDTTYFSYTATLGKDSNLFRRGNAKTMFCPSEVLFIRTSAPQPQSCVKSQASFAQIPFVADTELPARL